MYCYFDGSCDWVVMIPYYVLWVPGVTWVAFGPSVAAHSVWSSRPSHKALPLHSSALAWVSGCLAGAALLDGLTFLGQWRYSQWVPSQGTEKRFPSGLRPDRGWLDHCPPCLALPAALGHPCSSWRPASLCTTFRGKPPFTVICLCPWCGCCISWIFQGCRFSSADYYWGDSVWHCASINCYPLIGSCAGHNEVHCVIMWATCVLVGGFVVFIGLWCWCRFSTLQL